MAPRHCYVIDPTTGRRRAVYVTADGFALSGGTPLRRGRDSYIDAQGVRYFTVVDPVAQRAVERVKARERASS